MSTGRIKAMPVEPKNSSILRYQHLNIYCQYHNRSDGNEKSSSTLNSRNVGPSLS